MFGFFVCFFTVFYGFVQAHTMIFGRVLEVCFCVYHCDANATLLYCNNRLTVL